MRPTRRGYGVAFVVVAGVALAAMFGARSLNAVVVPGVVALAAAGVQLYRASPPALERSQPEPGFPGETRSVELTVESTVPCRVEDQVGPGLAAPDTAAETAGDATVEYEVTLERRGERALGPAHVVATDAFGLFVREFTFDVRTPVLVYPELRPLSPTVTAEHVTDTPDRQAFDSLREYVPGDPLRDIHWRSSAKRPPGELVVAEFAGDQSTGVTVAAETPVADPDAVDAMASAAASVAVALLETGTAVGLAVPDGRLPERSGARHRRDVLELLAHTGSGLVGPEGEDAEVRIVADERGTRVLVHGREQPFDDLVVEEGAEA